MPPRTISIYIYQFILWNNTETKVLIKEQQQQLRHEKRTKKQWFHKVWIMGVCLHACMRLINFTLNNRLIHLWWGIDGSWMTSCVNNVVWHWPLSHHQIMCILRERRDILVEEDSGADDKLEDVLQSLHGLQQLFRQLFGVVHVVLQDFGQLPKNTAAQRVWQICF